jgi:quinoprotein glucose dehydrogenase
VVAIDAATGETLWTYRLTRRTRRQGAAQRQSRRRILDRRQAGTHHPRDRGFQLVSLDAKTGLPDPAFGKNGVVDLYQDFDQPPPAVASSARHRRQWS